MSSFDEQLRAGMERQRQEIERQRLALRSTRAGCGCGEHGCCFHHAIAWNAMLEAERALWDGIRALEASAYQNGSGPRPSWWDSDDDATTIEALLEDVEIDLPGEPGA